MGLSCVGTTEPHEPPPPFFQFQMRTNTTAHEYIYTTQTHTHGHVMEMNLLHTEKKETAVSLDSPHLSPSPFGPPPRPFINVERDQVVNFHINEYTTV